ncbi:LysE family translocator [Streptomyces sp. BV129]|uniref:LysE family translocator n=1 Tax=Streptomyces sp. BV129 TaxID=2849671 RepID=UPI001C2E142C|nr:LysE family translocator [Streptomyces sp. BV129]MBV1948175.1 LysE family translocator [Streptomyces sp. BV129]
MWILGFLAVALLVALTPGANNLLALRHAMVRGFGASMVGVCGRLVAFAVLVVAVVAGLGPLLSASEWALTVIKWAGVAYLAYLGTTILWASLRRTGEPEGTAVAPPVRERPPLTALVRKEFLVAITNPKAILVFTAFVPQFVGPEHGSVAGQLAVLGACYLGAEAVAAGVFAAAGSVIRAVRLSYRAHRRMDRATGGVLLGMAGLLAAESA